MGYSPWGRKESDTTEHACQEVPYLSVSAHFCESLHHWMCLHMDTFLSLCICLPHSTGVISLLFHFPNDSNFLFLWGRGSG